jgi:hypothetical protein
LSIDNALIRVRLRNYNKCLKVAGSITDGDVRVLNLPNPSSREMTLGLSQPETRMSTGRLSGDNGLCQARKNDSLIAISEQTV